MRRDLKVVVAWILLFPIAACAYVPNDEERRVVIEMTGDMQQWGMGRNLVELPQQWRYRHGEVTLYYGLGKDFETVDVQTIADDVSVQEFGVAIAERTERIAGTLCTVGFPRRPANSYLISQEKIDPERVLIRMRTGIDTTIQYELHVLAGDAHVVLKATSYNNASGPVERRLRELSTKIQRVQEPARAAWGFILGSVVIRGDQDGEYGTMYFYDPAHRDVWLEVGINSFAPDEETKLLDRKEQASIFGLTPNDVLREGKVQLAGMDGQEILMSYQASVRKREPERKNLLFVAESYRPQPGFTQPKLDIRLTAGGKLHAAEEPIATRHIGLLKMPDFVSVDKVESTDPTSGVDSSLTDYEATAVWDAILKSIRLRPSAVAPAVPPSKPISYETDEEIESNRRAMDNFLAGNDFVDPLKPHGSR